MPLQRIVVDGSNIATEGRSQPSLKQLNEAVLEFQREFPDVEVTVVVDASFGHRVEEFEKNEVDEAELAGELVSPPAGAIGRGDAFLLRIAERTAATVLSNDSFQEFHGEHEWLFAPDRLIGGKPVPGVGWIFTPRTPVRGPKSRESMREARRTRTKVVSKVASKEASQPMPTPKFPPPTLSKPTEAVPEVSERPSAKKVSAANQARRGGPKSDPVMRQAIEEATEEAVAPTATTTPRRSRRAGPPPQAVNDPLPFITFIAEHRLGSTVEGEVESFTSHGAFVLAEGVHAYVPLSGLGDPPPRRARDVLSKGTSVTFVLQALDPPRRGVELALPGWAQISGQPSEETVEADSSGPVDAEGESSDSAEAPRAESALAELDGVGLANTDSSEPAVEVDGSEQLEHAAPASPRRRGRKATPPATTVEIDHTADTPVEEVTEAAEVTSPSPSPAPRRRGRKATPPAATVEIDEAENAPFEEVTKATEVTSSSPSPAPRRRGRKATSPATTVEIDHTADTPVEEVTQATEVTSPSPSPVPRRRGRKATPPADAVEVDRPESSPVSELSEVTSSEPSPAPRRRSRKAAPAVSDQPPRSAVSKGKAASAGAAAR